ncbi:type II toxin-antitoxin system HigB family toxin, partial [Enterobacter hormaechei]|nr:type II toxin-antitoxin system HigB family toxin [Enterobacter hormaechei]
LHGDVLMWLMKTLLTSGCTNQRGAGHSHSSQFPDCQPPIYNVFSLETRGKDFERGKIFIKHISTHAEYDKLTDYYRRTKE